jgi:hypothetical protein
MLLKFKYLIVLTFVLVSTVSFGQDQEIEQHFKKKNVLVSIAYGLPSSIRMYLNRQESNRELTARGFGPMMLQVEYAITNKLSIGINGFYGYSDVSWIQDARNPATGLQEPYRHGAEVWEAGVNLRANYYFYKKKNWNLYGGLGAGRGHAEVETYSFAPKERIYIHHEFPTAWTFEGTAGARYFATQEIALFAEIGIGQSWFLYNYYYIPAAFGKLGFSIKF